MNTEPRYELNIDLGSIKKGTEFEHAISGIFIDNEKLKWFSDRMVINKDSIPKFLADGIIRKVEEPKWTDSDMIEFVRFFIRYDHQGVETNFKNWLKSKQEEGV